MYGMCVCICMCVYVIYIHIICGILISRTAVHIDLRSLTHLNNIAMRCALSLIHFTQVAKESKISTRRWCSAITETISMSGKMRSEKSFLALAITFWLFIFLKGVW